MPAAWLLLLSLCARAAVPAPVSVPAPVPSIVITEELLARWSVPVEKYKAMTPDAKVQLQTDLAAGEAARLRRLDLIRLLRPQDWASFVDAKGFLTPDGDRLLKEREETLRKRGIMVPVGVDIQRADGKPMTAEDFARARLILDGVFDGTAALDPKSSKAGDDLVVDARVRNETVRSITVTNTRTHASIEVGQLGVDGRTPLLAPSPYANLTKSWESKPDSWVDYRVRTQIAYVDMRARFFADGPDPRVGRMMDLAQSLGVPDREMAAIRESLTYDDPYRAQGLVVGSFMAQMGRAYHLGGPVDVAWSVTSLTKALHLAPNQAVDESMGFRIRLPGDELFLGVFGGAMQNISPVGNRVYQELMDTHTVKAGLNIETAPHWTTSLYGRVPGMDDARFSVSVGQRYNRETTVTQGEAALLTSFKRVPIAVRAQYSRERGDAIEYDRRKARLQVEAQVSEGLTAYVAAERDDFKYGNAEVNSNAVVAGLTLQLDAKKQGGSRITIDHLFGGEYDAKSQPLRPFLPQGTKVVTEALADGLDAASRAADLARLVDSGAALSQIDAGLNSLSLSLSRLSPEAATALIDRLGTLPLSEDQKRLLADALLRVVPAGTALDERLRAQLASTWGPAAQDWLASVRDGGSRAALLDKLQSDAAHAAELLRLIGDQETWNAVAVSAGRAAMIKALSDGQVIDLPILDRSITLQTRAPVLIAAMGALDSRLSPLAPVKAGEAEPWLLRLAGDQVGLPPGAVTSDMVADRLVQQGQERLLAELDRRLAPEIDRLVASGEYDRGRIVSGVFGALPPAAADALRARFGASLEGLLPPESATAEQMRAFIKDRLAQELSAALGDEFRGAAAKAVADMASWAGELLRREINLATIQLMLAAEELDRLTVDHGRKASDLGVDMLARSFTMLDERKRGRMSDAVGDVKRLALERFADDDARLAARFTALGKERLSALQLDPRWPQGLEVVVKDETWAPMLGAYGDGAFFDLVGRIADKRRASGSTKPLKVLFEYGDTRGLGGTTIWNEKNGDIRLSLGVPKDQRDASFRLQNLESYVK